MLATEDVVLGVGHRPRTRPVSSQIPATEPTEPFGFSRYRPRSGRRPRARAVRMDEAALAVRDRAVDGSRSASRRNGRLRLERTHSQMNSPPAFSPCPPPGRRPVRTSAWKPLQMPITGLPALDERGQGIVETQRERQLEAHDPRRGSLRGEPTGDHEELRRVEHRGVVEELGDQDPPRLGAGERQPEAASPSRFVPGAATTSATGFTCRLHEHAGMHQEPRRADSSRPRRNSGSAVTTPITWIGSPIVIVSRSRSRGRCRRRSVRRTR